MENRIIFRNMNHQFLICGIFYCRKSAEIKVCGFLQTSSQLDSEVLRESHLRVAVKHYAQY